jgi:hypothetical protein
MKKSIFFAAFVVAIVLEVYDISVSGSFKVGALALVSLLLTFILDFKFNNMLWTSIGACATFSIIALSHARLLDFGMLSEQTYLAISMLIAGIALTSSFREVMEP